MKTLKYVLLVIALCLIGMPGVLIFISSLIVIFKGEFVSGIVGMIISLPFLYGVKMCISGINKIKHPQKVSENENIVLPERKVENENKGFREKTILKRERGYSPEYEIRYISSDGFETVRQIYVHSFNGRNISAYCFLRHEDRTFIVSRIIECVDVSTGELITENLHLYFNKKFHTNFDLNEMF